MSATDPTPQSSPPDAPAADQAAPDVSTATAADTVQAQTGQPQADPFKPPPVTSDGQPVTQSVMGSPTDEQAAAAAAVPDKNSPALPGDPVVTGATPAGEEGPTLGLTSQQAHDLEAAAAEILAVEHEAGFVGYNPDPLPNEAHTVQGVTQAEPVTRGPNDGLQAGGAFQQPQTEHPQGAGPTVAEDESEAT